VDWKSLTGKFGDNAAALFSYKYDLFTFRIKLEQHLRHELFSRALIQFYGKITICTFTFSIKEMPALTTLKFKRN
jgi:hypothetical protein